VSIPLFFFTVANPLAWPIMIPYMLHVLFSTAKDDGLLRYRSERFRSLGIWKLFAGYFPAELHKTHELPDTRKYIFGYHPHGIISHGAWAAFGTDGCNFSKKFPGITNSLLTLESNFHIPFYRDYLLMAGVRSVSRTSIKNLLTRGGKNGEGMGRAVTIVVGGARESLQAQPGTMRLIIKHRYGFIKLALRTGADLVPVLAFGETDLYDQARPDDHKWINAIQMLMLKVLKFTLPAIKGRGIFNYDYGMMPFRRPLNVVVGKPIPVVQVPTAATPSSDAQDAVDRNELERLHELYCAELQRLWDTYKDQFAPDRTEEMQFLA